MIYHHRWKAPAKYCNLPVCSREVLIQRDSFLQMHVVWDLIDGEGSGDAAQQQVSLDWDVSINHLEPTAFIQSHGFCVSKPILVYSNVNQLMLGGDILCEDEAV